MSAPDHRHAATFHDYDTTAIQVKTTSNNPTMKHVSIQPYINVMFLHDRFFPHGEEFQESIESSFRTEYIES